VNPSSTHKERDTENWAACRDSDAIASQIKGEAFPFRSVTRGGQHPEYWFAAMVFALLLTDQLCILLHEGATPANDRHSVPLVRFITVLSPPANLAAVTRVALVPLLPNTITHFWFPPMLSALFWVYPRH
jgi:hypothetical protein